MAPNLTPSQHVLIQSIIESKLQGEEAPTDKGAAKLATYSPRGVKKGGLLLLPRRLFSRTAVARENFFF